MNKKTINTKTTKTVNTALATAVGSKRYVVFSKNTLAKSDVIKAIRRFDVRDDARAFKRTGNGNYGIFDNRTMSVIR